MYASQNFASQFLPVNLLQVSPVLFSSCVCTCSVTVYMFSRLGVCVLGTRRVA